MKRSLCDYSFLIKELYHCKIGLNCKSPSKGYLTAAVNYRLFFKVKIKSVTIFAWKTLFHKFLHLVWFINSSVDYAIKSYYRECVRHIALRSGEHIGMSPITNKRVQPRKDSAACHHLLNWNSSPTFEDFSVLCHENKKYLFELKESLLIMRDRPSMNRNVRSVSLSVWMSSCHIVLCALWTSVISFLLILLILCKLLGLKKKFKLN